MSESFDLVIRGGTCVTRSGTVQTDIGIRDGRIAAMGLLGSAKAVDTFDAKGLHVLPGVIDTHVHFREPGGEHKEDMGSGSRAALLGGVTSIFEMPNTNPATVTREALEDKLSRAQGHMHCDHAFYVGATPQNAGALGKLEMLPGAAGIKAFMGSSTGNLLLDSDEALLTALKSGRRRMTIHAEDEARMKEREKLALPGQPATHPVWRDAETARRATERALRLAREAGRRIHLLHVTTAEEMPLIEAARDIATVEVTPHHLTFAAPEAYERLGNFIQLNPPIREGRHRDALWRAVSDGLIDVIGSDHAPHTPAEKNGIYPQTPSGAPGVQTMVTLLLNCVHEKKLTLERFVDLTSAGPARVFGIAGKGAIALGYDSDFTIVDLAEKKKIQNRMIASRCGWTPYDGMETVGWPVASVLRGHVVMRDGALVAPAMGRPLMFGETLVSATGA